MGSGSSAWERIVRDDLAGLVPYAPGLRASEVRERCGRPRVLKLSSNESPHPPFPAALRAIRAVAPRVNRYPDGSARALRGALAERLGVPAENLVVANGSNELLVLIAQAVLRPGDEVVFAWPSFVVYPMACEMFGATAVRVPLADDTHDVEAMAGAITERTRVVFLCNPNNPTGTVYRREALERFLRRAPEHVLVVADEAYFEYVTDPGYPDSLAFFDGDRPLAVLRTFSKMYSLAGLRVGYGALPAPLADAVHRLRAPFNVNTVAQAAAYHSLGDEAEVRRRRAENQEQKTYLYSAFDRLGVSYAPSEANFVYFHTSRPAEVFEALLEEGVIVRGFGTAPALRMTVGTPAETLDAVQALEAAAERLRGLA
ncbi:MAG: histidinol-phosphate transaminase [Coriobacteriia bacterium]|nr:histidinol-phosphate transaminase [Coriobacteriia bacterium]